MRCENGTFKLKVWQIPILRAYRFKFFLKVSGVKYSIKIKGAKIAKLFSPLRPWFNADEPHELIEFLFGVLLYGIFFFCLRHNERSTLVVSMNVMRYIFAWSVLGLVLFGGVYALFALKRELNPQLSKTSIALLKCSGFCSKWCWKIVAFSCIFSFCWRYCHLLGL